MAMKLRTTVIIIMALVWLQAAVVDGCIQNDGRCSSYDFPCCSNSVCVYVLLEGNRCKDKGAICSKGPGGVQNCLQRAY